MGVMVELKKLRLRDARGEDKPFVLKFCERTWADYGDYIARVWDTWIKDRRGRFIVAEINGIPVGIAKITDFGRGEIWLEGLRVDPRYRGLGIANALNKEVLRTLRRIKPRVVRYCTGYSNRASRHIGEKFGFKVLTRFRYYWCSARRGKLKGSVATQSDWNLVLDFILNSRFLRKSCGLIAEGWTFREVTTKLLRYYLRRHRIVILKKEDEITGAAIYTDEPAEGSICLGFVEGDPNSIKQLVRNTRYLAREIGASYCSVAVPSRDYPAVIDLAGLSRKSSCGQVIYEYRGRF